MKTNNRGNAYWYKDNIKKYRIGFLFFNFIVISAVFFIFALILTLVVEQRFFRDVEREIRFVDSEIDRTSLNQVIQDVEIEDPRITVVYYYSDPKDTTIDQILSPVILDKRVIGTLDEKYVTSIEDISNDESYRFGMEEHGDHSYITYVSQKWYKAIDAEEQKDILVCYVKIYMNVDGELAARRELNTGLIMCALMLMILGSISGYIIMKKSIKPLQEFVDKQMTFVSDASHELRTPLAIVQSKIENILANPSKKVYEASEDLAVSLKEISRLNKLTTDLLSLARSDQDRSIYHLEKTNMNILLSEIVEPFIEIASFEERLLQYNGEDVDALVDKDKIRELIIILLDNAMKYTNPNDMIFVSLKNDNNEAVIEVSDTGIGISEETKIKIFERFYREDKTRSRETGGNGLGLSIAKTIVSDLKGKIVVDHNEPKGTKFTITLPKVK